ncbi:MAG: PQQ-binding-like beta-propeller repeat protein [Vicinamibacteria bacterium]|nr:PQQ-binding-like beta-propeller repeat protein [Vicinamibacteria bacterium]
MRIFRAVSVSVLLIGLAASPADGQWTQFRGPNGSGVGSGAGYPVEFSSSNNVVWKAAVPSGPSSPVVVGGRLFVTATQGGQLITICLDAKTGKEVWRKKIPPARTHKIYHANDPASPTPVADDNGVVVFFPDFGLVAYSNDGKEAWRFPLGPFRNFYGMAASPIMADGMVVLVGDQAQGSFVLALERSSGRVRWKTERPGRPVGWATPMVFRPAGQPPQLVVLGSAHLDAYDLAGGQSRWWMRVASQGGLGTPVASGDSVLISTLAGTEPWMPEFGPMLEKYDRNADGRLSEAEFKTDADLGEHFGWLDDNSDGIVERAEWMAAREMGVGEFGAMAIRPDNARGQLLPDAIRWRFQKNLPFIPAPLVYQDVFYMVRDGGIITALDVATGKLLKEGRSREALGGYSASPVAADGKVYLANDEGKITVLQAGGQWQVLGVNDLGEQIRATPALSNGRIYVRTDDAVYCFGRT